MVVGAALVVGAAVPATRHPIMQMYALCHCQQQTPMCSPKNQRMGGGVEAEREHDHNVKESVANMFS